MIASGSTVKINRLCVSAFRRQCDEAGIHWQVSNTEINRLRFEVVAANPRRALLKDSQGKTFWADCSVLLEWKA